MNKQELIEKIDNLQYSLSWNIPRINKETVLDLIEQLDEPQKPVVPQFVADWYEENKDDFETKLFNTIDLLFRDFEDDELSEFEEWIIDGETKPFQTLVNMHQFGYDVKKEKRYRVKIKGLLENYNYLNHFIPDNSWLFNNSAGTFSHKVAFTRKELEEAGFGEVFNSPLFEVEEVTE